MKAVKIILIILVVAILGLVGYLATLPGEYSVERSIEIERPADLVYGIVSDFEQRGAWSPWDQKDPDMKRELGETTVGLGAYYAWDGNDSVGTGSMEIVETTAPSYIKTELKFTAPWESSSIVEWKFEEADGKTIASWTNTGALPFFMRWMKMDDMLGPEFERGLKMLKEYAENVEVAPAIDAEVTSLDQPMWLLTLREEAGPEMMDSIHTKLFAKLQMYAEEKGWSAAGAPMAINHQWDESGIDLEAGIPITDSVEVEEPFMLKKSYMGSVVKLKHMGPYSGLGNVHMDMKKWIDMNEKSISGPSWEVYLSNPGQEPDSNKWETEVYYPIEG